MSVYSAPLSVRQLEVLRWIVQGCPDGVMDGHSHKTTARALAGRKLVTLSRRGGCWSATATDTGRHYLAHGCYPASNSVPSPDKARHPRPADSDVSKPPRSRTTPRVGPMRTLIAEVIAASGERRYDPPHRIDLIAQLVRLANRSRHLPPGQELDCSWERGSVWVRLVPAPGWARVEPASVAVPATLRGAHPVIATLRNDRARYHVQGAATHTRGLRLLQALATALQTRGYQVTAPAPDPYAKRDALTSCHLLASHAGFTLGFRLRQELDRQPHAPTRTELIRAVRESWYQPATHDQVPTERLQLILAGGDEFRGSRWRDGRKPLEDQLGRVIDEVTARFQREAQRREDDERDRQARVARWNHVREQAAQQYAEASMAGELTRQAATWAQQQEAHEYLAALKDAVQRLPAAERAAPEAWLSWCRRHTAATDPLDPPQGMPAVPDPTADDLRPYMRGLNPYFPT